MLPKWSSVSAWDIFACELVDTKAQQSKTHVLAAMHRKETACCRRKTVTGHLMWALISPITMSKASMISVCRARRTKNRSESLKNTHKKHQIFAVNGYKIDMVTLKLTKNLLWQRSANTMYSPRCPGYQAGSGIVVVWGRSGIETSLALDTSPMTRATTIARDLFYSKWWANMNLNMDVVKHQY